jgi:hypothetical protein
MFTYRSRFLTRAEVWYDDEPDQSRGVDWIFYYQRSKPVSGSRTSKIYTYAIDLRQSPEKLLANLNKDTAYKIRRARERDNIVCEFCDPREPSVLDDFERMYNSFAAMKGISPLNRARTESMVAAGVLDLSAAKDSRGNTLVYHANYRGRQRATSMELPSMYRKLANSSERNFIGRASRYLTWSDILRYQGQGLKCFDFGGWYHGDDPAMLKINEFKRGFGGSVVSSFQCEQIMTLKGRIALATAGFISSAGFFPSRFKATSAATKSASTQAPVLVSEHATAVGVGRLDTP